MDFYYLSKKHVKENEEVNIIKRNLVKLEHRKH